MHMMSMKHSWHKETNGEDEGCGVNLSKPIKVPKATWMADGSHGLEVISKDKPLDGRSCWYNSGNGNPEGFSWSELGFASQWSLV